MRLVPSLLNASTAFVLIYCLTGCGTNTPTKTRSQHKSEGTFLSVAGEAGEAGFGEIFIGPPNLTLFRQIGEGKVTFAPAKHTIIVEVLADKLRWKNTAKQGDADANEQIRWTAYGQVEK
jgi:hypothetical protein